MYLLLQTTLKLKCLGSTIMVSLPFNLLTGMFRVRWETPAGTYSLYPSPGRLVWTCHQGSLLGCICSRKVKSSTKWWIYIYMLTGSYFSFDKFRGLINTYIYMILSWVPVYNIMSNLMGYFQILSTVKINLSLFFGGGGVKVNWPVFRVCKDVVCHAVFTSILETHQELAIWNSNWRCFHLASGQELIEVCGL